MKMNDDLIRTFLERALRILTRTLTNFSFHHQGVTMSKPKNLVWFQIYIMFLRFKIFSTLSRRIQINIVWLQWHPPSYSWPMSAFDLNPRSTSSRTDIFQSILCEFHYSFKMLSEKKKWFNVKLNLRNVEWNKATCTHSAELWTKWAAFPTSV